MSGICLSVSGPETRHAYVAPPTVATPSAVTGCADLVRNFLLLLQFFVMPETKVLHKMSK